MKKYRLKKDTPTIKAGTIFQEVTSDYDKSRELVRIMPTSGTTSPQWTINDINNFDEWFEEVRKFDGRKPKDGERYKYLDTLGEIDVEDFASCSSIDSLRLSIGNCYPINTSDEAIIKEQKLIPQAMRRLRMAAKEAWFEFNGSDGPDWRNGSQRKHNIYYNHDADDMCLDSTWLAQEMMGVYFPTKKSAQAYIHNNLDDLKLLFGVE